MDQTVIDKIKASFARQSYMTTLGAELDHIENGSVSIRAPMSDHILQQHGFAHAGVAFSMGDSAAGYAALTLICLLYTSPSPRDKRQSRMPSSA